MEEECYFSDASIIEQSAAMIQRKDGTKTNGISILVECPSDVGAVEVILEYVELQAALAELLADREAMPHLYQTAEAVQPNTKEGRQWVLHLIGPDDVVDQPDELTALREANKINISLARRRAEDPSDHDPHCWAVVKDLSKEPV